VYIHFSSQFKERMKVFGVVMEILFSVKLIRTALPFTHTHTHRTGFTQTGRKPPVNYGTPGQRRFPSLDHSIHRAVCLVVVAGICSQQSVMQHGF
jgi:hypothetical protein